MASLDRLGDMLLSHQPEDSAKVRREWHMPHISFKPILAATLAGPVLALVVVLVLSLHKQPSPIPDTILSKLNFAPFIIADNAPIAVDTSSYAFSSEQQGLIFTISGPSMGRLVVSEQASPQEFATSPDTYTSLINSMHRLSVIQSSPAPIYITRPNNQTIGQTAVVNAAGVLLFIQSAHNLNDSQWRQILAPFSQYQQPNPNSY